MKTQIEAARALLYQAASAKEANEPYSDKAAMAKLFASRVAFEVADQSIQLMGGYGYIRDFEIERYLRDAKITEIYEGTSEVQKNGYRREGVKMIHIVCLVKQVPDTTEIKIDKDTNTLIRAGVKSITNPNDLAGVEEALKLKDTMGAKVSVVTMGPLQAEGMLTELYARGSTHVTYCLIEHLLVQIPGRLPRYYRHS